MGNKERTEEILATLQTSVAALTSGDEWKAALAFQAKFHRYSFSNTLLIAIQHPGATYVKGFQAWKEFGRSVKKGEKGIAILAPLVRSKTDALTGEKKSYVGGFRTVYVFDVEQTEGEPFEPPTILSPDELEGDAPAELLAAIVAQIEAAGYSYELAAEAALGQAKGATFPGVKKVLVLDSASPLQQMKTAVHELAHIQLHVDQDEVDGQPFSYGTHRGRAEVEAESVAFVVCASLGLPTDDYSFAYVGGWSGGDMDLVKKTGTRVQKTAAAILVALEDKELVAA